MKYFVSYWYTNGYDQGYGASEYIHEGPLVEWDDIMDMVEVIMDKTGSDKVIPLYWRRMEEPE